MPFERIYHVDLKNGNLHADPNTLGWPDLKLLTDDGDSPEPDNTGLTFRTRRTQGVIVTPPANGLLPVRARFLVEATFDMPVEIRGKPLLWALWISLASNEAKLLTGKSVNVTCQFNRVRPPSGARLNTPAALEKPPTAIRVPSRDFDQASFLDHPLDLAIYQSGPSVFTLSLSFCGVREDALNYTTGTGFLKIKDRRTREDHRVFSSKAFKDRKSVGVLGAGVEIAIPGGKMNKVSARLRTFSVSINHPLPLEPTGTTESVG